MLYLRKCESTLVQKIPINFYFSEIVKVHIINISFNFQCKNSHNFLYTLKTIET